MGLVDAFLLLATLGVFYIAYISIKDPRELLKNFLTVKELGQYEGDLQNLERAVIVLHKIEDPTDSLRQAVRKNIGRRVKYLFLVSKSRYEQERELGYKAFEAVIGMELRNRANASTIQELVDIQPLPYDWDDNPYIFYELFEEERPGVRRVIAIRGNQAEEGIAEGYIKVEPAYARTIYRAVISRATKPAHLAESVEQLSLAKGNVIRLNSHSN